MSQARQHIIITQILPNISRSAGHQAIKFGLLLEYNVSNIFAQKSCNKFGRELVSDLFLFFKKSFI